MSLATDASSGSGSAPVAPTDRSVTPGRRSIRILLGGSVLTALAIGMIVLDPARTIGWELVHWNVAAVTALLAVVLSIPGSEGLGRSVRLGTAVALTTWLLSNLSRAILVLAGYATVPSISDLFALLFVIPGAWMLVISMHRRLSRAEEAAVYLDSAMVFVATSAVLLVILGPAAFTIGGVAGLLVAVYPAVFFGAAATSVVVVLATRQSLRPEGGLAFALGTALTGIAFSAWVLPTVTGTRVDHLPATLFSIGPMIVAYGAITWRGPGVLSAGHGWVAARISGTIGPVAVLVAGGVAATAGSSRDLGRLLYGLAAITVILQLVRLAGHLRERSAMLEQVGRLHIENAALVERLRREALERERVHSRLVDASRLSAVGELAAAVFHEVNNPLTSVLGYADLLLVTTPPDDPSRPDLEIIRAEALRVRDRIRTLLEFTTEHRSELAPHDLGAVVGAPLELLRYRLGQRGVRIDLRVEPMLPVHLDPPAIQQVVINLVSAMAASLSAGGRIDIVTRAAEGRASIVFELKGPEVDPAGIAGWFLPFASVRSADADPGGLPEDSVAASIGVLRGRGATIGTQRTASGRPQVEITLPFRPPDGVDASG